MGYRGDPSLFSKLIQSLAAQIQNLENATWDTGTLRRLDVATVAQLDSIGEIVGETRQGKSDPEYKTAIIAKIHMNASCGEPERLIAAIKTLTGATIVVYREMFPASVYINFESDTVVNQLYNYIQRLCPAGVQLLLVQSDDDDAFMFASGSSSEVDTDHGFSDLSQITGGKLSNLLT